MIARLALAALLLAACKKEDKGDGSIANRAEKGGHHECTIIVAAKPPPSQPISGSGSAPDEAVATEAAWKDACGKLPPPEQPACHDSSRYQAAVGVGKANSVVGPGRGKGQARAEPALRGSTRPSPKGPTSDLVTVTVTLTPAPPPQVTGKAASDESQAAACQAALLDACEKAGGQGDCVAAGTHEKKGEIVGTKSTP